ncbi:hypothetical protein FLAG1_11379 [Fusarium langsethiae]|uniref:Uncharacterized protein n=1 Tax=Fusarium langsethiae TaxID=179993 RepID=A0A0M9EMR2_FUSLA|nr:hypothetical protein FLAG1_11379 [Fusarium langsethiae]
MATNYWEAPPAPLPTSLNKPELHDLPTDIPLAMPGPYRHRASHIPDRVVKRQIKSRGAQSRKRIQTNSVGKNENYVGEESKYIDWLPQDENLLRKAWIEVERSRYQLILKAFLELGGSKNMRLCASDIQAKITDDLNLENDLFIETLGSASKRRRQKSRAGR